jgi:uncharacterized caspase-like protein
LDALIARASEGETVALFFAGHGVQRPGEAPYLMTAASDPDDLAGTALAWSDVAGVLSGAKARVAVLLDACQTGLTDTSLFASNDDAAASLLARVPSGLVVVSASKGREPSLELDDLGRGLFTDALVTALVDARAETDANANGAIEVSELFRAVKTRVVARSAPLAAEYGADYRQTPWLARNEMVGDFALF